MMKLEDKLNYIPYFDDIRRLTKVEWEDMQWNCLDKDTEILTEEGWKKYNEINKKDLVYSLNPFTNNLEKVPVESVHIYDYEGEMIQYDNNRVNFLATPNHRFLMYQKRKERNKNGLVFERAGDIPKQRRYFIVGSEGFEGKFNSLTDDQIKLLGWIISEGYLEKKTEAIYIYQKESRYSKEIENILGNLNINYTRTKNKTMVNYRIPACEGTPYRILLKNKKRIPQFAYSLSIKQKRLLISALMKGDGHWNSENSGYYCSADEKLIEEFQTLSILAGWNSCITSVVKTMNNKQYITYYANIIKEPYRIYNPDKKKSIEYKGKIWCISNRYENFLIKKNNRIVISGNSRIIDMLCLEEAKNQNLILPNKPIDNEKEDYEGAFREINKKGLLLNISEYDLSSAYPRAIIDFCLDSNNITQESDIDTVTIETRAEIPEIIDKTQSIDEGGLITQIHHPAEYTKFKQNSNALLPTVARKLIELKNKLGAELENTSVDDPTYKGKLIKYNSIKGVCNCFTPDTDVVTEKGIVNIKDIKIGDKVYNVNPKTYL